MKESLIDGFFNFIIVAFEDDRKDCIRTTGIENSTFNSIDGDRILLQQSVRNG